jgi:hypothetical protein
MEMSTGAASAVAGRETKKRFAALERETGSAQREPDSARPRAAVTMENRALPAPSEEVVRAALCSRGRNRRTARAAAPNSRDKSDAQNENKIEVTDRNNSTEKEVMPSLGNQKAKNHGC